MVCPPINKGGSNNDHINGNRNNIACNRSRIAGSACDHIRVLCLTGRTLDQKNNLDSNIQTEK